MKRLAFYLRYALRSLRRDGTRTFLAGLSVAFGVLSLIAMQLLANTLLHGSLFDQRIQYGGDAQIQSAGFSSPFTTSDLEQIETWHQQGLIAEYTPIANGSAAYLRTATNGRVTILLNALGIDPATYPLVGELVLSEPAGASAADVLVNETDVLVSRDIADPLGLHVGDSVLLSGEGIPFTLTVAGIVSATPTQQGDSVFYSLTTAQLLENRDDVINAVPVNWGSAPDAMQTVIDSPYMVFTAMTREETAQSTSGTLLFDVMLKGAGVLGLLVGGISVSNTLQVIMARRKLEIAMLKTLGYQQTDLLVLIGLETGLIGFVGGVVGAFLGVNIAGKLIDVLGNTGSLMLEWTPNPMIVIGGIAAGILTAVVFGMQAILAASSTRPVALLRDMPVKVPRNTQAARLGLIGVMMLVFGLLVGVVLGAPLEGILYVVGGGLLIIVLRGVFWVVLWVMLRLPLPALPTLRLARANLRPRKTQSSLAVLALFAGAFSVTFAALVIYNAQSVVDRMRGSDAGYNLMIYTSPEGASDALSHMILQGAEATYTTERLRATVNGQSMLLEGREPDDLNTDMRYDGIWMGEEDSSLLPDFYAEEYAVGDVLTIEVNGQTVPITLAGFYRVEWDSISAGASPLIIPRRIVQTLGGDNIQTRVIGTFPVASLSEVTTALGESLPTMLVFSRADMNDSMTSTYQALFTFAASVAGLAFVAGAVLIANSTGLSMIERRREIGVFKAVGYTSSQVLRILLSEYGFLGLIAGVFGVTGAACAILFLNISIASSQFTLEPMIISGMLLFSVSIAVVSALVVAWQPTRVRPLNVLRYE